MRRLLHRLQVEGSQPEPGIALHCSGADKISSNQAMSGAQKGAEGARRRRRRRRMSAGPLVKDGASFVAAKEKVKDRGVRGEGCS